MSRPSLEGSLLRTYVLSVIGLAACIVVVGALTTLAVVIERDDAQAVALARTLGAEVGDDASSSAAALDEAVAHELEEQHWFGRTLEVWRGARRIGGDSASGRLRAWTASRGCETASHDVGLARVCVVRADPSTAIVVASPMKPMFLAALPVVVAVASSALLAVVLFALGARRLVRRDLAPLRAFEQRLDSLRDLEARGMETSWGAAEIDDLARAFDELLGRIHAAVEREQRFVSNAAHELRTPLTRLRGQIDLVAEDAERDAESTRRLRLAARSCDELAGAVDALLALARDRLEVCETVDLGELADELVAKLPPHDVDRVQVTAGSCVVRGDSRLLGLALRNLVDNALKYSEGPVRVHTAEGSDGCCAEVVDEGPGIPADELSTVREAFERGAHAAARARGSGLGLALVDHVARLHEGILCLEGAEPKGLRAALQLPAWTPGGAPPSTAAAPHR